MNNTRNSLLVAKSDIHNSNTMKTSTLATSGESKCEHASSLTFRFKQALLTIVVLFASFIGGCGYQMGSLMHPQIKTIAIGPVKNETIAPFLSAYMRQALCEQFQFDGSLKLKGLEEADCVLYGKITKIATHGVKEDSYDNLQTYRASEWRATVTFEFVVVIPGKEKLMVNNRIVNGTARFQVMADQAVTKVRGFQQACRDAAAQAVIYTTEAW